MKIFLIAGARPNFMKIAPIARAFDQQKQLTYKIVHTGQHYDANMSGIFFEELGIRQPDYHLDAGGGTHAQQTAKIMTGSEEICEKDRPDLVMVGGEVNSTLACSIVAKKMQIKVAHVEAGLRSFDLSMPEEINRMVTDSISDLFFITEEQGMANLIKEGKDRDKLHFVGHVMIDNLFYQLKRLETTDTGKFPTTDFKRLHPEYGVVTLHRPSNVDHKETLSIIFETLSKVSETLPLIFPIHPRTRKNMEAFNIKPVPGIKLTEPLSYMEFLNLWKDAKLALTDSGGLQEETTALGIPCLTIRENTERPVTLTQGTNVLVGLSPEKTLKAFEKVISGRWKTGQRPKFWDGKAAERILHIIETLQNR
jgi:UDP-N-acetylglucosamine 2-epimerase (non-hydrolysing)